MDNPTPIYITDLVMAIPSKSISSKSTVSSPSKVRATVKAVSHDDNEEFSFYKTYLNKTHNLNSYPWDVNSRLVVRITDNESKTLFNDEVSLINNKGKELLKLNILANGEFVLFPNIDLPNSSNNLSDLSLLLKSTKEAISLEQRD